MIRSRSQTVRSLTAALALLGLTLSSSLLGCGGHAIAPSVVTLTGPASDTIDPGDTASFTSTVTGGPSDAGVTWALTGCSGSSCGTLSNVTLFAVTYTAPATVTTAFTVTLTAMSTAKSSITGTVTLTIPANPGITTTALASGTVGAAYAVSLAATGGIPPYTWAIAQGALPSGLTLSSTTGAITGTPTAAGSASFTVKLADSGSPALTASSAYTLTTAYPPLNITTASLPNGTEGTAYTATLAASGGSGTGYTWSVLSGTALSAVHLSLSPAGAITGIPNASETSIPVTVQVTDSAGNQATATLSLTVTPVAFQGQVLSGTTPVANATLQLYAVGSAGNASAATPMLTQAVITDGLGMFQLTGLYTCGQSSTGATISGSNQVYLVAAGGTPSTTSTTSNPALVLVTAVGPCSNLATTPFFTLNEVTTAAAAWALAPFSSSSTNIGAAATNTLGISNAFLDAALLANPTNGAPATLTTGLTVETGKLNALADALNSCTTAAACTPLFTAATPANGTAPLDTFTAALNIVHHPGENVAAVYATIPTTPPFATTPLAASPNDWTMSLTVTGGGLASPTALGIDSLNNIWVVNEGGPLSVFNPQGTALSATGYGLGTIAEAYGLAIDPSNNIWVTHQGDGGDYGSVMEFYGVTNPATQGTFNTYTTSLDFPDAVAIDNTNGYVYVANSGDSSATVYNSSGVVVGANLGASQDLVAFPPAIAIDSTHGFWLSGETNVVHYAGPNAPTPGATLANVTCCGQSYGMATDATGNLWVADYLSASGTGDGDVAEVVTDSSGNSTAAISGLNTGGIDHPIAVAVDSAQNAWFSNSLGDSITELAGSSNTLPAGTAISPTTGVYTTGGYGLDAGLDGPFTLLPDRSGNLWVSNEGALSITMFFGLAAPTVTPLQPVPTAP
jgi:Putative Ig domain